MKITLGLLALIATLTLCSQEADLKQEGELRLYGRMENDGKMVPEVSIEVIKDNQIIYEGKSKANGSYTLELELGSVYNIAFQKEGYVTKQVGVIAINTIEDISGTYTFQLDLELFKIDAGDTKDKMLPPVAKLYIRKAKEGFTYDKNYVKWVAGEYEEFED